MGILEVVSQNIDAPSSAHRTEARARVILTRSSRITNCSLLLRHGGRRRRGGKRKKKTSPCKLKKWRPICRWLLLSLLGCARRLELCKMSLGLITVHGDYLSTGVSFSFLPTLGEASEAVTPLCPNPRQQAVLLLCFVPFYMILHQGNSWRWLNQKQFKSKMDKYGCHL